jgi:hypothetical protein
MCTTGQLETASTPAYFAKHIRHTISSIITDWAHLQSSSPRDDGIQLANAKLLGNRC